MKDKTTAKPKTKETGPRDKALLAARLADDKKALGVEILGMGGLTSFTDYFVICSGESTTQVKAIADYLLEKFKEAGFKPLGIEGLAAAKWVLLDFGDVIVHVFERETREFYSLERLWLDAPRVPLE